MRSAILYFGLVHALLLSAQTPAGKPASPSKSDSKAAAPGNGSQDASMSQAAARRNENVYVNQIDNDATKEANIRLGDSVTLISQPLAEAGYYASEHGRAPSEAVAAIPSAAFRGFHGELYELLQNSVFNARTFFQVGKVKPSRQNSYGGRFVERVKGLGVFTGNYAQRKVRGMVNGNALVPLATERTPLATDPAVRALVARFLKAYPDELPNRTDLDPRALNTNSPQTIDQIDTTLRLDREFRGGDRVSASYSINRQKIDAFQLVAGQNPDTEIHNTRALLGYQHTFSEATAARFSVAFQRSMSDLRAEPNAAPSLVKTANQLADLLPEVQFPIHRAQNTFRGGAVFSHRAAAGRHLVTWGADASRYQMNGVESANPRGGFTFSNDAVHSAVDNLRLGLPGVYEVTVGPMNRGFRNADADFFAADQWKIGARLQLYYGLRYNLVTAPTEVNDLNRIPYGCDCNNFSPRFSIAYRLPGAWVVRTGYTVSFGQIYPVTYGQVRFNEPLAHRIQVQSPEFVNPLRGIDFNDPKTRQLPTRLAPDLVSPYAHQYNFNLERHLGTASTAYLLRLSYIGSRTFKPLEAHINNRAVPVPGIPLTVATVDQRRADPRYVDVRNIVNGGAGYLDAAQFSLQAPARRGLVWGLTYTFGKALDTGSDYAGAAANTELTKSRPQSQFDSYRDRKGLSNFDSTHSLVLYYAYNLPRGSRWMFRGWQVSGAALAKTGTPFTITVGSDNPGFGNVDGGTSDRPNLLDPSILGVTVGDPDTSASILRRDRFSYITPGESRGNLARNAMRKGGIANFNAALTREFHWHGSSDRSALLRAEAFNLTNHAQFDEPQRTLTGSSFGKITNTLNDGRVMQLSVRLQF